jgi:MerR family redox-sensitive transcriptional activator SoxR
MEEFRIAELAQQAGVRPSALRYYESVGLLPRPKRVNGRRRYDASALQRLSMLQLAQQAGFTIAEIQTPVHGFAPAIPPAARWTALAREKLVQLDAQIERAQHGTTGPSMINLKTGTLERKTIPTEARRGERRERDVLETQHCPQFAVKLAEVHLV